MDIRKESLKKHEEWGGKIEIVTRCPINTREELSLAYTPGVAEPCLEMIVARTARPVFSTLP